MPSYALRQTERSQHERWGKQENETALSASSLLFPGSTNTHSGGGAARPSLFEMASTIAVAVWHMILKQTGAGSTQAMLVTGRLVNGESMVHGVTNGAGSTQAMRVTGRLVNGECMVHGVGLCQVTPTIIHLDNSKPATATDSGWQAGRKNLQSTHTLTGEL